MKIGFFRSMAALLAGAGAALAQQPAASPAEPTGATGTSFAQVRPISHVTSGGSNGCSNGGCATGCDSGCEPMLCDNGCGNDGSRWWFKAEVLFWDVKDATLPPISSTIRALIVVPDTANVPRL